MPIFEKFHIWLQAELPKVPSQEPDRRGDSIRLESSGCDEASPQAGYLELETAV